VPLPELASAVKRRVIGASVWFQVKVGYGGTICKILIDVIHCISFEASGERSHLSFFTLVPDHTLHKTLAASNVASANREKVDLSGGSLELHGSWLLMNLV